MIVAEDKKIKKCPVSLQPDIENLLQDLTPDDFSPASGQEKEDAKADMEKMLDYIDTLNELDTAGIEPMSHVFPVQNVFREDVVTNGDNKEATLANAPLRKEDSFEVPKTIG